MCASSSAVDGEHHGRIRRILGKRRRSCRTRPLASRRRNDLHRPVHATNSARSPARSLARATTTVVRTTSPCAPRLPAPAGLPRLSSPPAGPGRPGACRPCAAAALPELARARPGRAVALGDVEACFLYDGPLARGRPAAQVRRRARARRAAGPAPRPRAGVAARAGISSRRCPLHWRRALARGYNQAAPAGSLGRARGSARRPRLGRASCSRARHARRRPSSTVRRRRGNLAGAIAVRPGVARRPVRVLVVDDVTTTGSTLTACLAVVRAAGAACAAGLALLRPLCSFPPRREEDRQDRDEGRPPLRPEPPSHLRVRGPSSATRPTPRAHGQRGQVDPRRPRQPRRSRTASSRATSCFLYQGAHRRVHPGPRPQPTCRCARASCCCTARELDHLAESVDTGRPHLIPLALLARNGRIKLSSWPSAAARRPTTSGPRSRSASRSADRQGHTRER